MATLIGVVSQVVGEVYAVAADGTRRPLAEGDRVFAGEQIVTGSAGAIAVAMSNGRQLTLGRDSDLMLSEQLLAQTSDGYAPAEQPSATTPSDSDLSDVEQLQAAIEAGIDPTLEGEATAAGPGAGAGGAGGAGGGHSFVLLDEVGGQLDPVIGFSTEGLSSGTEFPDPDPVVASDEPDEPVVVIVDGTPRGAEASNAVDEEGLPGGIAGGVNDLAGENASVNGTLGYDFGPDGAGSFAWSTTGLPALTSGGVPLVYSVSGNGQTLTATAGETPVFTLTLTDLTTGGYTFTLLQPLDHPLPEPGSSDENDLDFLFNYTITDSNGSTAGGSLAITVDDDSPVIELADSELPVLLVDETDLSTDATADFSGAFSSAFGADAAGSVSYALGVSGDPSGLVDVATGLDIVLGMNGNVVEGWVGGDSSVVAFTVSVDGSGNVTLDQLRALQHPDGSDPNDHVSVNGSAIALVATVTDADGDQASASLDLGGFLSFHDDGPSIELADAELPSLVVDETDLSTDATADFSGAFSSVFGADGVGSVSYALSVTGDPSGLVDVATGDDIVLGMNGSVVEGWVGGDSAIVAFTVSVDGSGNVTLDQLRALQHPDDTNSNDQVSVNGSAIALVATVTDADGDSQSASLSLGNFLNFHDDGPSIELTEAPLPILTVDETNLATDATADFSGAFSLAFGADGAGSVSYAVSTLPGTDSGLVDVATGLGIVLGMNAGVVEGWVDGDSTVVAFTVSVDGAGNVTLDQLRALQHPDGTDPNDPVSVAGSAIALVASVTDADGDSQSASLNLGNFLSFRDDGPSIELSGSALAALVVDETILGTDATADFSGAFSSAFGADGAGSVSYVLSATGDSSGLVDVATGLDIVLGMNGNVVEGWVGGDSSIVAFTVSADGAGNVTLDQLRALQHPDGSNPNDPVSVADSAIALIATVTDADGDQASASLSLGNFLTFHDDGPSIELAEAQLSSLVVDETDLSTDAMADFSGAFSSAFGADGAGSVSYALNVSGDPSGLVDVATGLDIVLGMNGSVVEGWVGGDSSVLAFTVSVDGSGNVTLDQLRALQHPDGSNPDDPVSVAGSAIALVATVTDADGDQASASLSLGNFLSFHDDGPSIELADAQLSSLVVDETDLTTDATADFSSAFSSAFGADGAGSVSYSLSVSGDPSGLVDVATGQDIVLGMNGSVVEGWVDGDSSVVAFTVGVDGSGNVTLDQLRALQHPDGTDPNDPVSIAGNAIALTATVTDADGDQASVSLNLGSFLSFHDDGPSISLTQEFDVGLEVDETNLAFNASTDVATAFSGSFGADGAGTTSYTLSTVDGTDSGLVDVASDQSILLYNTASGVEGRVGGEGGAVAFGVTLLGSSVTLDQVLAIKHPSNDPNEPISPTAGSLMLTATITDRDGDSADASLDMSGSLVFRDDGPSIERSDNALAPLVVDETDLATDASADFSSAFSSAFGADGAGSVSYSLSVSGDPSSLVDVATGLDIVLGMNGSAVEGWVGGDSSMVAFTVSVDGSGNVTLDQLRALQHPEGTDPNDPVSVTGSAIALTATVTDADGDQMSASLDLGGYLSFHDDGPSIELSGNALAPLVVDETDLTTDATADFSSAFSSAFGADGAGSVGYSLSVNGDPSGLVDVATGLDIVLGMNGAVVEGWVGGDSSVVAFTVSVDGSGNVTFDQLRALQHSDSTHPDDPVSVAGSAIALTATVTDADGDQVSSTLDLGGYLSFRDDGPSLAGTPQTPVQITGLVHEDLLASPHAGNGEGSQTLVVSGLAGALHALVDFGADGAGSFMLATDVSSLEAQALTSGGESLSYGVTGGILTASVSGYDVFTLQVGSDGSYTFTLLGPLDHPLASGDDSETLPGAGIDFSSVLVATDGDGDPLAGGFPVGSFTIDVEDDIPVLHGVQNAIMGNFAGTLHGAVDIAFGADGLGSFNLSGTPPNDAISYDTVNNPDGSSVLTATIVSSGDTYFVLTLNADGTYDFELVNPSPTVEVTTTLIGHTAGGPVPVLVLPINGITATFTELADSPASGGINSSGQGMGVDNNLISGTERMKIAFSESIANVGFTLNKLSTSDIMTWAVFSAGILIASGTWSPPAGNGESSDTLFNILDPATGSTLTYTFGSAAAIEASGFDELHLGATSGDDYRLLSITVSEELFPGDVDLTFDLGATDGDGDPIVAGLNITLEGDGAEVSGFTLTGTSADEVLLGGSGNDTLLGNDGDDVLIGGLGNDSLTGGSGADSFKWLSGDSGTDSVTDFVAGFNSGGDQLDLSELLVGESAGPGDLGNLLSYIDIATSGANTVVTVSSTAVADPAAAPGQTIVLENVDLYVSYGVGNEADLVLNMLGDGTLKVDTV